MSRRIKIDRRCSVDRNTTIEITRVVECPNLPPEFVASLERVRDYLWRASWRLPDEDYRYDGNREGMAIDLGWLGEELDGVLKELRLIPDDSPLCW